MQGGPSLRLSPGRPSWTRGSPDAGSTSEENPDTARGPDHDACLRLHPADLVRSRPRRTDRDDAGNRAADRGGRPLEGDARRAPPLRRAQDRRVGRGTGEVLGPRPVVPGGLRDGPSGPTASRSGGSSGSSTRACPRRWSVSATTRPRPWWPRTTPSGPTRCAGRSSRGSTARACCWSPRGAVLGHVIALPDADQTPEQIAGLVPASRPNPSSPGGWRRTASASWSRPSSAAGSTFSGNPRIAMTNQPHREWVYRQAYHMGRHVIGYEVQKVLAAVDWFERQAGPGAKVGVAGYGEGGLIAFYAAAADPRIDAALVSGYFGPRQRVWAEPIYRNVWGLLPEFGDAEIATLIAPRGLVVEHSEGPRVDGPARRAAGAARRGRGRRRSARRPWATSAREWERLAALLPAGFQKRALVPGDGGVGPRLRRPGGRPERSPRLLGVESKAELPRRARRPTGVRASRPEGSPAAAGQGTGRTRPAPAPGRRRDAQRLPARQDHADPHAGARAANASACPASRSSLRRSSPARSSRSARSSPRTCSAASTTRCSRPTRASRRVYDTPKWTGYEVMLDVYPDVFAWGILLVPKGIKAGERRPGRRLPARAERPAEGRDRGRQPGLSRLRRAARGARLRHLRAAQPLPRRGPLPDAQPQGQSGQALDVLVHHGAAPADPRLARHAAVRRRRAHRLLRPELRGRDGRARAPLLDGYCLSICSGDFNDWARKVASTDSDYSFMFTDRVGDALLRHGAARSTTPSWPT